jgi:hypothetical protein
VRSFGSCTKARHSKATIRLPGRLDNNYSFRSESSVCELLMEVTISCDMFVDFLLEQK